MKMQWVWSYLIALVFIICSIVADDPDPPNFIQVTNYHRAILISELEFDRDHDTCRDSCDVDTIFFKNDEHYYEGINTRCSGWLEDCTEFDNSYDSPPESHGSYCLAKSDSRIIWARGSDNFTYEDTNPHEECIEEKAPANLLDKYGAPCFTCMCVCVKWRVSDDSLRWAFNLVPQESDVKKNRIVTGVRIKEYNRMIYLEIKEGQIGSESKGTWKSSHKPKDSLKLDSEYSLLTSNSRSVGLDKIFVPADYAVTGVKFVMSPVTSVKGQNWMIRLHVQGTKFDQKTGKLVTHTKSWYSWENSAVSSINYKDLISPTIRDDITNDYIVFRNDDRQNTHLEFYTLPYISTREVKPCENTRISGIQLAYDKTVNDADYIFLKIFSKLP